MKRWVVVFLLFCGMLGWLEGGAVGGEFDLVASSFSDRYHVSSCKVAKKIPKEELVRFASPEEAIAAGLNPCKKCYPPTTRKKVAA